MKGRTTIILFVITALAFAYIYFFERKQPNTEEAQRQSRNVLNITPDKITGIVIQNGDDKIDLERHDKKWRLEAPIKDQADSSLVENLFSDLESWQKDTTIAAKEIEADKNKLNEFGLAKPKLKLKLTGESAPAEIFFGKDSVLEGKMYVRFENSKETFVVSQTVKKAIEKKADDFRDRKLTDLNTTQVTRAVLKTPTGEMELEKKGDHWEIIRPLRARGDDQKIGDLIAQITTAHIEQFVSDDKGDLHPYGLAEPRGSLALFGENDKQGQMLQIGGPAGAGDKQKDQVYVRSAARGFVYALGKKIEEILNTKPNDLRDRHLARIDRNILDRITIDAAGKGKTVLARKSENWTIASRNNASANSAEVQRLIDTISNEQVTKFVEDVASNLPKYGLDRPALTITFSSFASENTAETKAGEQPFATIAFGKAEGDNVFARVGEEPFVVAVRKTTVDSIATDPLQWQELAIFNYKPEEIHRLMVTVEKELSLVRGPNNQWALTKGNEPINQVNVQTVVNTLCHLHAVRWVGATIPQHGFDKPQLVISFTSSPDDKATHKLTIGASSGNGMWFARSDEREGTFVVSNPDLTGLKSPLIQTPTPTPSPVATGGSPSPTPGSSPTGSIVPSSTPATVSTPKR